jgi:hypothetical protein
MGKHALESFVSASYQPLDGDLTSIAGLSGSAGLLRKTGIDTFTLDTNTYLTGNQTITLSGDVSGSGTTSVSVTLANSGVSASTYGSATQIPSIAVDAKGRITSASAITFESLPSQTGQSGKYLTTNGTVASWGTIDLSSKANINSPTFTGIPAAPTAAAGTNTTQLATTAFVTTADNLKANLASPTFTGVPAAPTAAADTNTTQIATTAFVVGQVGTANPVMNGTVAVGTSLRYARQDHVHASDTSRAPLASPALSGTPTAPTAAAGTNTTQIATTAFVTTANNLKANLASPTFTGVPAAPTAAADTNTTQVATTAYVIGQASSVNPSALGAVAIGNSLRYARANHVHPTTGLALLTGATFTGVVTGVSPTAAGSIGFRRQTMSTAAPSGGLNGDVWLRY